MIAFHPEEKLIISIRKHWLAFVLDHLYLAVLAIVPLVFSSLFVVAFPEIPILFYCALWLLALWVAFAIAWTNYYLDVWYLTDERLIDIDQKGMFLRNEATVRFGQIQDVTIETSGILGTLFGFGTIYVQTAGESPEFKMRNVANPERTKEKILALAREFESRPQRVEMV